MIYTTLNKIRVHGPCASSWTKLLESLGKTEADDDPLPMVYILDLLGLDDCLWATRSLPEHGREWRLFSCDCAERALVREREAGREPHGDSWRAVEVSRRFAVGEATGKELVAARAVAGAAWAAGAAWDAAWAAGDAAVAAWDAEREWQTARLREYLTAAAPVAA